jgi:hypothetical protein
MAIFRTYTDLQLDTDSICAGCNQGMCEFHCIPQQSVSLIAMSLSLIATQYHIIVMSLSLIVTHCSKPSFLTTKTNNLTLPTPDPIPEATLSLLTHCHSLSLSLIVIVTHCHCHSLLPHCYVIVTHCHSLHDNKFLQCHGEPIETMRSQHYLRRL